MYSVVLEVDDNVEPLEDAVFDKQQRAAPGAMGTDVENEVVEALRVKQRGRRSPKQSIKV